MNSNDKIIGRINELANKQKKETLTEDEIKEQQKLRKIYLKNFREGFISQIKNIKVVNDQGEDVTPDKIKELKKQGDKNEKIN
ncbi:DUF896 domain-containing protein [Spiroplasma endosymbiont of Anurida maritima]|uniref:DUF896 domain-containing protein n=1 Tax=Spiroplasma endosymbiont of Anurida maritima TaxID=2967972 RepID=UPI0036D35186